MQCNSVGLFQCHTELAALSRIERFANAAFAIHGQCEVIFKNQS